VTKILITCDISVISLLCERMLLMHLGRPIRDYRSAIFMCDERLLAGNGLDNTFKNYRCREILRLREIS
jgi:hypothetical protein